MEGGGARGFPFQDEDPSFKKQAIAAKASVRQVILHLTGGKEDIVHEYWL
jgi:hypothetical protein